MKDTGGNNDGKKKYYYQIEFPDETIDSRDDEYFDSEEEAQETAEYALGCCSIGADTLHLSNPGDYPDPGAHTEDAEIFIYKA